MEEEEEEEDEEEEEEVVSEMVLRTYVSTHDATRTQTRPRVSLAVHYHHHHHHCHHHYRYHHRSKRKSFASPKPADSQKAQPRALGHVYVYRGGRGWRVYTYVRTYSRPIRAWTSAGDSMRTPPSYI